MLSPLMMDWLVASILSNNQTEPAQQEQNHDVVKEKALTLIYAPKWNRAIYFIKIMRNGTPRRIISAALRHHTITTTYQVIIVCTVFSTFLLFNLSTSSLSFFFCFFITSRLAVAAPAVTCYRYQCFSMDSRHNWVVVRSSWSPGENLGKCYCRASVFVLNHIDPRTAG